MHSVLVWLHQIHRINFLTVLVSKTQVREIFLIPTMLAEFNSGHNMQSKLGKWPAGIIMILAIFGVVGAMPVSIAEFNQDARCPSIGPVPICYLVLAGYITILVSILLKKWNLIIFLMGWLPIFLFALVGSSFELAGYDTCPKNQSGWPKCYFSLMLACAIVLPLLFRRDKLEA